MIKKLKALVDAICMSLLILVAKTLSKVVRVFICIKYLSLKQFLKVIKGRTK